MAEYPFLEEAKQIRELNKMSLILMNSTTPLEYTAYMEGGVNFGITSNMEDMTSLSPNMLTTALVNVAGFVPAFDMPRWYAYKGTKPISFSINTYLKLENDINTDVVEPFKKLCQMVLPSRSDDTLKGIVQKTPVLNSLLSGFGLIDESNNAILNKLDDISLLKTPLSISPTIANSKATRLKLRLGKFGKTTEDDSYSFKFGEVVVTGMQVSWGRLLVGEGWPERFDIGLTIETMRCATTNILASIFAGSVK
jgi:hypothetical protein